MNRAEEALFSPNSCQMETWEAGEKLRTHPTFRNCCGIQATI